MRKLSMLLALVAGLFISPAYADFTAKDAAAATITFKNPGVCTSVVCTPVFQIYDGTNVVTLTTAGADAVSNTLTGQPVYGRNLVFNGTTWDRWTGAVTVAGVATAANQTTEIASLGTIATNSGTAATSANQTNGTQQSKVFGPTANGSAAANPPVVVGGTSNGTATGNVGNLKVDSNGTAYIDAVAAGNLINAINGPLPVKAGTLPSTQTPVSTGATTSAQSDLNGNLYMNPVSLLPAGATAITASATGTTAATTATLAGAVGKTTYICGYSIRANATATTTVTNTVTGVITATMSSIMWVPANTAGLGVDEQIFSPCIPASGTNQAIAAVSGAPGTGGVVSSKAWGYQQ